MSRIRIIKKNDEFNSDYDIGDIFEVTGTWYGGVHVEGKSGVPVSLDKDEYTELDTEPEAAVEEPEIQRDICVGDIVRHFKREWVSAETSEYLYKVLAFAQHTETGEKLVIYQALYAPFKIGSILVVAIYRVGGDGVMMADMPGRNRCSGTSTNM